MKVDTIKGSSYVMTCTKACTVSAIFNSGETSMLILEAEKKGQYGFAAPTDAVEVSDEEALIEANASIRAGGISTRIFVESDIGNQHTALATEIVSGVQRRFFRNYKLLKLKGKS